MMSFFLSVARSHCLLFGTVLASQGWLSVSYCYCLVFLPHRSEAVEFAPFDRPIDIRGGGGTAGDRLVRHYRQLGIDNFH